MNLGCETTFFTALGDDELGRRARDELEAKGLRLHVSWVPEPQRRGVTYVDDSGERTITVIGDKHRPRGGDGSLPWEELRRAECVYFTGGGGEPPSKARPPRGVGAAARGAPPPPPPGA